MGTAPVKSQPLHDFPISFLKWSHRCGRSTAPPHEPCRSPPKQNSGGTYPSPFFSCSPQNQEKDAYAYTEEREGEERETEERRGGERETEERVWNLRPRRPMGKAGTSGTGAESLQKSARRHVAERKSVCIALSREEIEEDVYAMTGGRPARRPKKRPRNVQKQLDSVFPGLYLIGITEDAYRVDEATK